MQTEVEELAENKVRLTVQVPRADVHHAVEHAVSDLAASVKIPGFRKGKVPTPVLMKRVGRERVYQEAIDSHIGGWFWNAAARQRLRPVAQPEYDFQLPDSDERDWEFRATVAVQSKPEVAEWNTLEVGYQEPEVPGEIVEEELRILQGTVAELAPVEGRPATESDTVVIDLVSPNGERRQDYVVELGRGTIVEEIEHGLVGMSAGESKEIEFELAEDGSQKVGVTVKEIREKVLPPLDDELARAASEFDTLGDLRSDIEERLLDQLRAEAEASFRAAVADKLVESSKVDVGGPLVESRTRDLLNGLARQVERRGVSFETYLTMTGTDPNELVERIRAEAAQSVARELVLEAAADKLEVTVPDADVEESLRDRFADADDHLEELRGNGLFEQERQSLRMQAALDRIAGEVRRVELEVAAAREAIWTPDKEKPEGGTKLWTPGDA